MSSVAISIETSSRLAYSRLAIMPIASRVVLFLAVFGNGIDITHGVDRGQGVSLSFQVVLRIATGLGALAIGSWAWWRMPTVRKLLYSYRGWLVLAFICFAYGAVINSVELPVSLFVATMLLAYTLLACACITMHGFRVIVMDVLWAVLLYVILSWGVYIYYPDIGTFKEYLTMTQSVNRMGGLGHPNTLGRSTCLVAVMMLVAARERWIPWQMLIPVAPFLVITLIESKSRSPVIATACAIIVFCLPLLRDRMTHLMIALAVLASACGLLIVEATQGTDWFLKKQLLSITKSGDLTELTSLTGRTEIWAEACRLILQRPWLGFGGGTSAVVMVEQSGHAHNMLLETAILYGIPAALIVLALLFVNIKDSIYGSIPMIAEVTTFVVLLGMVESPMVGMPADPLLGLWLACIFARPLASLERHVRNEN
jgi:exopolysaccharide production protein ExoQ